jgi:hypothetical protein
VASRGARTLYQARRARASFFPENTHGTVKLSPLFNDAQLDSSGDPLSGGKVYWYAAGSSTAQNTYTDILNARGEPASARRSGRR